MSARFELHERLRAGERLPKWLALPGRTRRPTPMPAPRSRLRYALAVALMLHGAGLAAAVAWLGSASGEAGIALRLGAPALRLQLTPALHAAPAAPRSSPPALPGVPLRLSDRLGAAAASGSAWPGALRLVSVPQPASRPPPELAAVRLAEAVALDQHWTDLPAPQHRLPQPAAPLGQWTPNRHAFFSRATAHLFRVNQDVLEALAAARRHSGRHSTVEVRLAVDRHGRVVEAAVLRSSGDARLDAAALGVVQAASPLPRMSEDMTQARVEFSFPVEVVR